MGKRLFILLVVVMLLYPTAVLGEDALKDTERIESFSSRIAILPEGGIEVTETIILVSHGETIRWGLERLLPRWHETESGLEQASGYEFLEVLIDGVPVEYSLTDTEQGLAVTVGDSAKDLPPGRYVYTLSYRCSRLVQFHSFSENLDWNVTGTWPVPIQRVTASLEFARAPRPGFDHWTATVGHVQFHEGWTSSLEEQDWLRFETTRTLQAGETMSIQATWPRGYGYAPLSGGRILDLDSEAALDSHRQLTVQELITVYNDGKYDQGIFRDFSNLYRDDEGNRRIPELDILRVTLNGGDIPWSVLEIPNGQRLAVGSVEHPLPRGNSSLFITYSLDRQVLVGKDLEELRWSLPGFPLAQEIDQARFSLALPRGIDRARLMLAAFTRLEGEVGSDVFHYIDDSGRIVFATTRAMEAGETLVSSVAWPAGSLPPLTWQGKVQMLLRDNASAAAALFVLFLLVLYYVLVWTRLGRRPLGKIAPIAAPPDKLSPAHLRFLRTGIYDNRTFTAAALSLAVKGCLMIVEEEGKYALVSSGISPYLPADEDVLMKTLFAKRMAVIPAKHKVLVKAARRAHKQALSQQVMDLLRFNRGWFFPVAILSLLGAVFSGLLLPVSLGTVAGLAGFVLWGSLLALVAVRTWGIIPGLADERGRGTIALVLLVELTVAGTVTYFWGNWLAGNFDGLTIAAVLGIIAVNAVFFRLLTAPTPQGREVLEQTRGFRAWLVNGGEGRPGGPSRFEKFLPYSVALDVSSRWGRRFGVPKRKGSFSPRWYQGSRWHTINAETLAASLSMLPRSKQDRM